MFKMIIAAAALFILPVGDHTHQVVVEYDDGGPPVIDASGELRETMFYRQGPYKQEDCQKALRSVLLWFSEAEEQINKGSDQPRVKIVGGRCEKIS